jgi:hypothetical protein
MLHFASITKCDVSIARIVIYRREGGQVSFVVVRYSATIRLRWSVQITAQPLLCGGMILSIIVD